MVELRRPEEEEHTHIGYQLREHWTAPSLHDPPYASSYCRQGARAHEQKYLRAADIAHRSGGEEVCRPVEGEARGANGASDVTVKCQEQDCAPFIPLDDLDFALVAGSVVVCRPVPPEYASVFRKNVRMVRDVVRRIVRIRNIYVGTRADEILLVDRPLKYRVQAERAPIEDLRLADQMVRLVIAGTPKDYGYWHLQFYLAVDVGKLLGRDKDGYGKENGAILSKIENMTGSRIMVAPYDPLAWRRAFLLTGEQELVERAVNLLSGAIQQKLAPTGEGLASVSSWGETDEDDERFDEIKSTLSKTYGLELLEVERDGNCLFRAMSLWEYNSQDYHRKMRRDVIEYLTTTPEAVELAALVENVTPAEYLESMRKDSHWGGYTELTAYAERYHRNVRLFVENPSLGLRATEHEVTPGADMDRIQLLLYKSHYWLLVQARDVRVAAGY